MSDRIHRGRKYYDVSRRRNGTFKKVDPWSPKDEGCFIATAAYGTPMAIEINYLRQFRDNFLKNNFTTKQFVYTYYIISPHIAKIIIRSIVLKKIIRILLKPFIIIFRRWYKIEYGE